MKNNLIPKKIIQRIKTLFRLTPLGFAMVGGGIFESTSALASPSIGVSGALAFENPSLTNSSSTNVKGATALGGGFTFDIGLTPAMSIEGDLLYLSRKFSSSTSEFFGTQVTSTVTSGYLHIPVLVQFHVIPFLQLGIGAYYSRVISSWSVAAPNFAAVSTGYGNNDMGFVLGASSRIPIGEALDLGLDLRYTRSLTDSGRSSSEALKFADIQLLAGLRFNLK